MKVLLIGIVLLACNSLLAQEMVPAFPKLPKRFVDKAKQQDMGIAVPQAFNRYRAIQPGSGAEDGTMNQGLNNSRQVRILPQDGMPCIIPEAQFYQMPVVRPRLLKYPADPGSIPNRGNIKAKTIPE